MAMSDYSLSDIAAVTDGVGGGNRNGGGWGDGGGWWILLLFILLGWGNGNRGWGGNGGGGQAGGDVLYPWLNQAQLTTQGFADQNAVMALNGIQSNLGNLSTQLCNCCSDIQMALANGFAGVEAGANARQMATTQQLFGVQTAMMQGFNGLQSQFADCCCENRLGLANLNSTILAENCADRAALSDGIRDLLTNNNANTQRILDKLCDQELFAERRENDRLRQELNMQTLAASQAAQNAFIQQGFANEVDQLYNRLNNCPVPTTPVYGRTPIFTCQNQCGCNNGCGCN